MDFAVLQFQMEETVQVLTNVLLIHLASSENVAQQYLQGLLASTRTNVSTTYRAFTVNVVPQY